MAFCFYAYCLKLTAYCFFNYFDNSLIKSLFNFT